MEFIAVGLASVVLGAWLRTVPQQGRAALEATGQLLDAARHGRLSIITSLVDSGVPVDSPGDAGETALMAAAGAGQTSAVELLLSLGASVTARMEDHLGKASSTRGLASGGGAAHAAAAAGSHEASSGPARPTPRSCALTHTPRPHLRARCSRCWSSAMRRLPTRATHWGTRLYTSRASTGRRLRRTSALRGTWRSTSAMTRAAPRWHSPPATAALKLSDSASKRAPVLMPSTSRPTHRCIVHVRLA